MRTAPALLASLSLLVGCGAAGISGLKNVASDTKLVLHPEPALTVNGSNPVLLSVEPTGSANSADCPIVNGEASIDGTTMQQFDQGGSQLAFDGDQVCHAPSFALALLIGDDLDLSQSFPSNELQVKVQLHDGTATWNMTVVAPFDQRGISLISPADGVLHGGDAVVLAYSPPTDVLSKVAVGFNADGEAADAGFLLGDGGVTVTSADLIEFTVPRGLAAAAGTLFVSASAAAQITACSGPAACEAPLPATALSVPASTAD